MSRNTELTDKLLSVLTKPVPHYKTCSTCGKEFPVNSDDSEIENCMMCQIKIDLHIDDNTIINYNIINLWKAKRYDKVNGMDPLLCAVAEGIFMLPDDVDERNHLTVVTSFKRKFGNDEIEDKLKSTIKKANGKYDAVLILRFNPKDDISIFKIRVSDRLYKRLNGKSLLFIKKFFVSLVVKSVLIKGKKKGSKRSR